MQDLLVLKTAILGGVFAVFFIAERLFRSAPAPTSRARVYRNLGLWLVVALASPLIVAPITAFGANNVLWTRDPALMTGWVGVVILLVDLIILDLWTYWLHRTYHRFPVMWRLHEVHHRDAFLDTTSAVRFHLGEVVLSAALRLIPIMLLAPSLMTVIIFETLLLGFALFHHSNIRLPNRAERLLSFAIVTPSIHWVHHHAVRADTDSNYGAILSLWDRLFTSRSSHVRTPDMKIGAEGVEELSFIGLLLSPFMRKQS